MKVNKNYTPALIMLTRGAMIAALYVLLSWISSPLQVGNFQIRLSEALCLLPAFMPEAIVGLSLGCALSGYITGCLVADIIFGTLATFIGALVAWVLGILFHGKHVWLYSIPNVISNSIIMPFVIVYAYGVEGGYFLFFGAVLLSEIVACGILGTLFTYRLSKTPILYLNGRNKK